MPHPEIPMVSSVEFAAIAAAVGEMFGPEATREVFARYNFSEQLLSDETLQLSNVEYMRFLEACARTTGEPLFGALIGDRVAFNELGLYGRYVMASGSLATALQRASQALRFHETGSRLEYEINVPLVRLTYIPPTPKTLGSWHQSDGVAAMLINLIRDYEDRRWKPSAIRVAAARGPRRKQLCEFFGTEVEERELGTEIVGEIFDPYRADPSRTAEVTWRELRTMVSSRPPETFSRTLRSLIDPIIRDGLFELTGISERIGVSPRTVQRRLAAEGTRFGTILQESRRVWAEEMLTTTSYQLSEIATLLGYTSKQHFIRAYRGWTGITPAAFRSTEPKTSRQGISS